MDPSEIAAQALADLQAKAESDLAELRAKTAEAKARLEQGLLNVRAPAERAAPYEAAPGVSEEAPDMAWDFEPGQELGPSDEFGAAPPQSLSFDDELDVAVDADGIPLGE